MQVLEAIRTKRAVRAFTDETLPQDVVDEILNAGRRAQSSKNSQPWHFLAVEERETLQQLADLGSYAGHLSGAALGVLILTPDPNERWSIMFDAGQAAAYMQLAGWARGVGSCPATIYEPDQARQLLGFPQDLHVRAALSFGYPADPSELTDPPHPSGRKPFEEVVHFESWS